MLITVRSHTISNLGDSVEKDDDLQTRHHGPFVAHRYGPSSSLASSLTVPRKPKLDQLLSSTTCFGA